MTRRDRPSLIVLSTAVGACLVGNLGFTANVVQSDVNDNTAMGSSALDHLTTGTANTAAGYGALSGTDTGTQNTGFGLFTLIANTSGGYNTAMGTRALANNTTGSYNTALGGFTLQSSVTASYNTAVGYEALYSTTTGHDNTAMGEEALFANTTGQQNMAVGRNALRNNTTGSFNAAMGYSSCWSCRSGSNNVGYGFRTLYNLNNGSGNIAIGPQAGSNITGSNNIEIGNEGITADSGVIRIGAPSTQTKAFIAGISGSQLTGAAVYVNSSGQLGVLASSERYKTAITPMGDNAAKLDRLRPVTFHLKSEPKGALQYGLIAEEVDRVYPELVIRDDTGKIQGVRYDELAPLLLQQVQEQRRTLAADRAVMAAERAARLQAERGMQAELAVLKQQNAATQSLLAKLQGAAERVAMR